MYYMDIAVGKEEQVNKLVWDSQLMHGMAQGEDGCGGNQRNQDNHNAIGFDADLSGI
jgi:hypothetical protein